MINCIRNYDALLHQNGLIFPVPLTYYYSIDPGVHEQEFCPA